MIEQKLQKQLKIAIILVLIIIVVLFICGAVISAFLQNTKNDAIRSQVIAEADEYESRILKQLDANFQTLSTLSAFIEKKHNDDIQVLAEHLRKANSQNHFLTMMYYSKSEKTAISATGQKVTIDTKLTGMSDEERQVVEKALEGTASVSKLFKSEISNQRVFAYGVPVYSGNEIIGVLAANDHIQIFNDILSGSTVLGGGGYIHMLNSQGKFLVRSPKTVVQEDMESIFDGPYLDGSSREKTRNALQNRERIFSNFNYEGKTYPFLLEPLNLNGWYLFCVNTGEGLSSYSSNSALVIQVTFIAVLMLVVFMMIYGYRLMRNYSRSLIKLAYYDSLTGAENLSRFQQRLAEAVSSTGGSVAAISIRQFPFINEIFGKDKANRLLCQIKKTADRHIKKEEFFCRDTADRFYIFFRETNQDVIRMRLESFIDEIEQIVNIGRTNYQLAIYCGVSVSSCCNDSEKAANNLMTSVLFALERAKGSHKSMIWFFDAELHKKEELENYIESHMNQALLNQEFNMFLQPKKNLKTGKLEGAEALVRWKTGEGTMIFPNQFIPLFESNGFCVKLDLYMVEQACRQIRSWIDRGIEPIPISVNQSKLLFFETDYVDKLTDLCGKYDISPKLITLEILEGMALENVEELNVKIIQLQEKGFRISLDDFGSGFSSLNTLGKLKIDELKLDRDFLMNASSNEYSRIKLIMEQVIRLAGKLGIATVAEGVETLKDEQFIQSIGCDFGQGYLYSKPLNTVEFDKKYMN